MSLVNTKQMLEIASLNKYAVANFDVFNIEMLKGIINAAQKSNSPVILAYGEVFEEYIGIDEFAALARKMAQNASTPIAIHLDHAESFDTIIKAICAGFTSVMIDASSRSFDENLALTKEVVRAAKPMNVCVEAELGHVTPYGQEFDTNAYEYTDPILAREFVEKTGIDSLAVAIGTVHGHYSKKPELSLSVLDSIRECVDIPLVLHGGSGLSDDDFRSVIEHGISKINIFTDLISAAMKNVADTAEQRRGISYLDMCYNISDVIEHTATEKIKLFMSENRV